jgi:23S rRNA (uracil1939-C5)-methyltransferase
MKPIEVQAGPLNRRGIATCVHSGREFELPFAIPGERVRAGLPREEGSARLLSVLDADPARVDPPCPHFGRCARCQWMMVAYDSQLSLKKKRVEDAFRDAGIETDTDVRIHGLGHAFGTRTHMRFGVKRVKDRRVILGLPEPDSRWLSDIDVCPAQLEVFNGLMEPLIELLTREPITIYDEGKDFGKLFGLALRGDPVTGEVLLIFVMRLTGISKPVAVKTASLDPEGIVGVLENLSSDPTTWGYGERTREIHGRDHFFARIRGHSFKIKGTALAPISHEMYGRVLERLDELLPGSFDRIVHGGSGIGLPCLQLASRARKATGIESDGSALRSAQENAELLGQGNVEFVRGTPEDLLPGSESPDVLILSPKRGSLGPSLLRWISEVRPRRVLLQSSDLQLIQDVSPLIETGYGLISVDVYDFMPHTPRVDVLITLS